MDIETAKKLQYHNWLHHESKMQGGGQCLRIRVNGAPKTWKTRPDEIRLPVRFGARARDQFALYEYEIGEWEPERECRNPNHPQNPATILQAIEADGETLTEEEIKQSDESWPS